MKQVIRIFCRGFQKNTGVAIASLIAFALALAAVLLFEGIAWFRYLEAEETYKTRRLFTAISMDDGDVSSFYQRLSEDSRLPEIAEVTISDDERCGIYISDWHPTWEIGYGDFFTEADNESASNVVFLSEEYIASNELKKDGAGDVFGGFIDVNGTTFLIRGSTYCSEMDTRSVYRIYNIPAAVCMPLNTYIRSGFKGRYIRVLFSTDPTTEQIEIINELARTDEELASYKLPETISSYGMREFANKMEWTAIVYVISLFGIVNNTKYRTWQEHSRYQIYVICGASYGRVKRVALGNAFLLTTTGFALAALIAESCILLLPEGRFATHPAAILYLTTYLLTLGISCVTAWIDFSKYLRGGKVILR